MQVAKMKTPILNKATRRLLTDPNFSDLKKELRTWRREHSWVDESALFYCLATFDERTKDKAWWTWPNELRQGMLTRYASKEACMTEMYDVDVMLSKQCLTSYA